jgi:hypothetical protein
LFQFIHSVPPWQSGSTQLMFNSASFFCQPFKPPSWRARGAHMSFCGMCAAQTVSSTHRSRPGGQARHLVRAHNHSVTIPVYSYEGGNARGKKQGLGVGCWGNAESRVANPKSRNPNPVGGRWCEVDGRWCEVDGRY